jgi:hypothetical protein
LQRWFHCRQCAHRTVIALISDSGSGDADTLYRIDLSTGVQTKLGKVQSLGQTRIDVEGLAFSPDGTLYGVDDDSMKLFPINTDNGAVIDSQEVSITGMGPAGGNDFGLTFACDGSLYATSVSQKSLYRLNLDGTTSLVDMGQNMAAGSLRTGKTYGLSNGLLANGNLTALSTSINIAPAQALIGAPVASGFTMRPAGVRQRRTIVGYYRSPRRIGAIWPDSEHRQVRHGYRNNNRETGFSLAIVTAVAKRGMVKLLRCKALC